MEPLIKLLAGEYSKIKHKWIYPIFLAAIWVLVLKFLNMDCICSDLCEKKYVIKYCLAILFLVLLIIFFIYWYLRYIRLPMFRKNKYGILISLGSSNSKSHETIERIHSKIISKVSEYNAGDVLEVKTTRVTLILKDADIAKKCLRKTNAQMIVFAELDTGNSNHKEVNHFDNIYFLVRVNPITMPDKKEVFKGLPINGLEYETMDNLNGEKNIAEGVFVRAMILVGNALRGARRYDIAIKVFEELRKAKQEYRNLETVKKNMALCKFLMAHEIYDQKIYTKGILCIDKTALEKINSLLESSLSFCDQIYHIYVLQAIVMLLLGKPQKTWNILNRMQRFSGKNKILELDFAFMFAYEGNVVDCERKLNFLLPRVNNPYDGYYQHAINFSQSFFEQNRDRYHILYHIAKLYMLINISEAIEYMKEFKKQAEKNGDLASLNKAKEEIKKLSELQEVTNVPTEKLPE